MDNLKISRVIEPKDRPSRQEWINEFRVSSMYVEPFKYYEQNHFDVEVYSRNTAQQSMLSGILKHLNFLSWVA